MKYPKDSLEGREQKLTTNYMTNLFKIKRYRVELTFTGKRFIVYAYSKGEARQKANNKCKGDIPYILNA